MSATIRTAALAVAASFALLPAVAPAAAKPHLRACYDGNCKITITKKVSFPVDNSFGITRLTLSFKADRIYHKYSGPGLRGSGYFDEGGSSTIHGILVYDLSVSKKKAVLALMAG